MIVSFDIKFIRLDQKNVELAPQTQPSLRCFWFSKKDIDMVFPVWSVNALANLMMLTFGKLNKISKEITIRLYEEISLVLHYYSFSQKVLYKTSLCVSRHITSK